MGAFEKYFEEPVSFSAGMVLVDRKYSDKEAAVLIGDFVEEAIHPYQLRTDKVRFGFAPDGVEDVESGVACWYTGARGKGAKEVWVLDTNEMRGNND